MTNGNSKDFVKNYLKHFLFHPVSIPWKPTVPTPVLMLTASWAHSASSLTLANGGSRLIIKEAIEIEIHQRSDWSRNKNS